jgi:hypothetical protein
LEACFESIDEAERSEWVAVVDARRGVGREAKGMEMFCSRENERVRGGASAGTGRSRRVAGDGEDLVEGMEGAGGAVEEKECEGSRREERAVLLGIGDEAGIAVNC